MRPGDVFCVEPIHRAASQIPCGLLEPILYANDGLGTGFKNGSHFANRRESLSHQVAHPNGRITCDPEK